MLIEGKNSVYEALKSGQTINKLIVQNNLCDNMSNEIIRYAKSKGIRIDFMPKEVLDKKTQNRHQGFICEVTDFNYGEIEDIFNKASKLNEDPFIIILDGIEDPHNFGAIIRTAECAGVHGIIIPTHRSVVVNDTVVKTSAGATANMIIARVNNLNYTIDVLKKENVWVYCLETGGDKLCTANLKGSIALVIGSEGRGVSRMVKENCDGVLSIELKGKINSLNESVAGAVAMYEVVRQRT